MEIATIGVDVGKIWFHAGCLDRSGAIVTRHRFNRSQLLRFMGKLDACMVGMEASCGSHHLARALVALGHDAKLMSAKFVRPFLKGNKNDYLDAEAIAEAVQRPTVRFVPIKTCEHRPSAGPIRGLRDCGPWSTDTSGLKPKPAT
jgi:transposase